VHLLKLHRRGFLIESADGPVWLYGTAAEHNALYDYQISHASNVFMGIIQHETAYYQGNPKALSPYNPQDAYTDPTFEECQTSNCPRTWGLRVINSENVFMYGGGLYSFFNNWDASCLDNENCQERMVDRELYTLLPPTHLSNTHANSPSA
jgi:glucan 1,3-beta-glucosidase